MKKLVTGLLTLMMLCACALAEPMHIKTEADMQRELSRAIRALEQPAEMDVSGLKTQWGVEIAAKNAYYAVLSEDEALAYAYNVTPTLGKDGVLRCEIAYMPYKTGDYPADFEGISISTLGELIAAARDHLAKDAVNVRIENPALSPADMSRALQQAGDGYVLCQLSADGMQIVFSPSVNRKLEEVADKADALKKCFRIGELAQRAVDERTHAGMSQRDKARALYAYLTENVVYDYRYYNDWANFSDRARTALGAFEDHLAICGGFAQALQALFERAGIPCYTVSGVANGEDRLWNVAKIDGEWALYDATFDAGRARENWRYFGADIAATTDHVPSSDVSEKLMAEQP